MSKHSNHAKKFLDAVVVEWWNSVRLSVSCTANGDCLHGELVPEPSLVWPTESIGHVITVPAQGIYIKLSCVDDSMTDMRVLWFKESHCCHAHYQLATGAKIFVDAEAMQLWGNSIQIDFAFITPPELAAGIDGAVECELLSWPIEFIQGDEFSITRKMHERVPLHPVVTSKRPPAQDSATTEGPNAKCGKM